MPILGHSKEVTDQRFLLLDSEVLLLGVFLFN
jgi:hypothetical protein